MQDYSKVDKYIRKTFKVANFTTLEDRNKKIVLEYLRKKKIDYVFYDKNGYDILRKLFFVREYTDDPKICDYELVVVKETTFETFDEYYKYLNGNIDEQSCYYGYEFTDEQIKKYTLDIKKLNFDSYSKKKLNDIPLKKLLLERDSQKQYKIERINRVIEWINCLCCPKSYDEFITAFKYYRKHFSFVYSEEVFFSTIVRKYKEKIKPFILKLFCDEHLFSLHFYELLLMFGNDVGDYVIENYDQGYSPSTISKAKRGYKNTLTRFKENDIVLNKRRSSFDKESYLYIAQSTLDIGGELYHKYDFFLTFEEFANYVGGDLTNCNLSSCNEPVDKIKHYKTDDTTILPSLNECVALKVIKKYDNNTFKVKRKWLNENDEQVIGDEYEFDYFCDFVHFLDNDLSNADLLMCPNIENIEKIKNLNLDNIKVTSYVAEKLGVSLEMIPNDRYLTTEFNTTKKNEISTIDQFQLDRPENFDYRYEISYVTDIHLIHRIMANKCKSHTDSVFVMRNILKNIKDEAKQVNLIGGDIASDLSLYEKFINGLEKCSGDYFITLGNHELWKHEGMRYEEIIEQYASIINRPHIHFVHNNIFMCVDHLWEEIPSPDLINMTVEQIKEATRKADLIIFGGIAFAGFNNDFNANDGIYRDTISREEETQHSKNFEDLYHKICEALDGKNVIILTHMPFKDWTKDENYHKGFIYVSGHNHRNFYIDNNDARVFADNQIGYSQKEVHLKKFTMDRGFNWFESYGDGIYEITRDDYIEFYRGIKQSVSFNRAFNKLLMLKRKGVYLFLMENEYGNLCILNGGSMKKAPSNDVNYFFDNMVAYSESMNLFLGKYFDFQKSVAKQVIAFGGDGFIHGSIVDIDFFNHLYINPLDGTITPYFAYSMVDKTVYMNLPSLLSAKCPDLYSNLIKSVEKKETNKYDLIVLNNDLTISDKHIWVTSTEMYKVSRVLKGLQLNSSHKVIRFWSDSAISEHSEKLGKDLVSGLLTFDDED